MLFVALSLIFIQAILVLKVKSNIHRSTSEQHFDISMYENLYIPHTIINFTLLCTHNIVLEQEGTKLNIERVERILQTYFVYDIKSSYNIVTTLLLVEFWSKFNGDKIYTISAINSLIQGVDNVSQGNQATLLTQYKNTTQQIEQSLKLNSEGRVQATLYRDNRNRRRLSLEQKLVFNHQLK